MVRVLITDPVDKSAIEMLRANNFNVTEAYDIKPDDLKAQIVNYDAVVVRSRTKITREVIEAGKNLSIIGRSGVGLENIDLQAAKKNNIKVVNSAEAPTISVAELVLGLALAFCRRIPMGDASLKRREWLKKKLVGSELKDKHIGIIGFGRIGRAVASRAKAFDMRVCAYDVIPIEDACKEVGADSVSLETLLKQSDYITIHVPLLPATKGMINAERLKLMKNTAVIINTARGGIVDEKDLLDALNQNEIGGAALDVFSEEPPQSDELLKLINHPNVISTPHIGANTKEATLGNSSIIANKLINHFKKS